MQGIFAVPSDKVVFSGGLAGRTRTEGKTETAFGMTGTVPQRTAIRAEAAITRAARTWEPSPVSPGLAGILQLVAVGIVQVSPNGIGDDLDGYGAARLSRETIGRHFGQNALCLVDCRHQILEFIERAGSNITLLVRKAKMDMMRSRSAQEHSFRVDGSSPAKKMRAGTHLFGISRVLAMTLSRGAG
ncbi:MAG TPA: hypothetical protein VL202_24250 [Pararhizobium sp.]|uniref:hypothetical protein n=1 Tax=Pararhizobium sp. TaxID=1977563 RepID=UPI002C30F06F|nr:hypothetical protein [Pararhizobium sp.]HTO34256.1 hypothetical protein [Pararhizobium sp.]